VIYYLDFNMKEIFWGLEYIPEKVKQEFIKRWYFVNIIPLEEFMANIKAEENKASAGTWWWNAESILHCYEQYKLGCIGIRYPPIPMHPEKVLENIISEVNEMINFK
jgi:hypothetical protein